MEVWVVEEGNYEESEIVGIYSSEELVHQNHPYIKTYKSTMPHWVDVSKFEVDKPVKEK